MVESKSQLAGSDFMANMSGANMSGANMSGVECLPALGKIALGKMVLRQDARNILLRIGELL